MSDIEPPRASVTLKVSDTGVGGEVTVAVTANPPFPRDRKRYTPAQALAAEAGAILVGHPSVSDKAPGNPNIVESLLRVIEDCDCADYAAAVSKIYEVIEVIKADELRKVEALMNGRGAL